jgi:hypothetical protein
VLLKIENEELVVTVKPRVGCHLPLPGWPF